MGEKYGKDRRLYRGLALAVWVLLALLSPASGAFAFFGKDGVSPNLTAPESGPLRVEVGIMIDQITSIDQKSENFGAVAVIKMRWTEPKLAFDPNTTGRDYKLMTPDEFIKAAKAASFTIPLFLFHNQQNQRWEQEAFLTVLSSGEVTYYERSTLTLQAPLFNFEKYPFDTQVFTLDLVSVAPLDIVELVPMPGFSGLGDMLGEEAWILENPELVISTTTGATGQETAKASLQFTGRRHIQYYFIRIFIPMLVLLVVSWATFFLEDYRKRIDIAGGNLLVFVAFNFAISDNLPRLGYITFLDFVLQSMFLVTAAVIVLNVGLRRMQINGHEDRARRVDNYVVKWIFPLGYAGVVAFASFRYLLI